MGHSVLGRIDEMGKRIDELEESIAALLDQTGLDRNILSARPSSYHPPRSSLSVATAATNAQNPRSTTSASATAPSNQPSPRTEIASSPKPTPSFSQLQQLSVAQFPRFATSIEI
jgi:Heat shock factor binding protein 1